MLELDKIYNMDCIEGMKLLDDESIDLVVTSPPYNCGIDYDVYDDSRDWGEYLNWCKQWLIEIKRILKSDGRVCVNVLVEMGINNNKCRVSPYGEFYNLFKEVGLNLFGSPIWVDSHRVKFTAWGSWLSASSPYIYNPYEVIIIGYKDVWKKSCSGHSTINKCDFMMGCSGIWKLRTQTNGLTKANYHTDLSDMCIKLLSYENALVFDPFMGSGTTAVSCKKLNRRYIGFEISEDYYNISLKRLMNVHERLDNFGT